MNRPTLDRKQRSAAPHRAALIVLIVLYTFGLAGVVSLLLPRGSRSEGHHLEAARAPQRIRRAARPGALHPAASRPTPGLRHRRRVIVWSTPAPRPARAHRLAQWRSPASRPATVRPPVERRIAASHPAPARRIARRPVNPVRRVRVAQRPSGATQLRIVVEAPREPTVTWAHPPDMSLPPECRPRNPVVVSQN